MWLTATGLLLTLLGVAATAGWLELGRPRRLKRAGAKAQVWATMPPGVTRDLLAQSLEQDVALYLRLEADRVYIALTRLSFVVALVQGISFLFGGVLWLVVNQSTDPSKSSEIWLGVFAALGFIAIGATAIIERQLRTIRKRRTAEQLAESDRITTDARATMSDLEEAVERLTAATDAARPWLEAQGVVLPPPVEDDRGEV